MKVVRYGSHNTSWVTTDEIYAKMFLPVGPKTVKRNKKRRKNTKKGYFKAFYVLRKRNN